MSGRRSTFRQQRPLRKRLRPGGTQTGQSSRPTVLWRRAAGCGSAANAAEAIGVTAQQATLTLEAAQRARDTAAPSAKGG